jgi:hypothetical protein
MSNENGNGNANTKLKQEQIEPEYTQEDLQKHDDTMDWITGSGNKPFMKLPSGDGSIVAQFFKDKRTVEIIDKEFTDPKSQEKRIVKRVNYKVIDPEHREEGEKNINVPRTLAQKIEMNKSRGHYLLELIRTGTGLNTKYDVIAVD